MKPWERQDDTEAMEWLKKEMIECYETAVNLMQAEKQSDWNRDQANYYHGMGNGFKMLLEELYDFNPEQEMDIDDMLCVLDEL